MSWHVVYIYIIIMKMKVKYNMLHMYIEKHVPTAKTTICGGVPTWVDPWTLAEGCATAQLEQ